MIEIIATNASEAKIIEHSGANRIELISAFSLGGLTPSYGTMVSTLTTVKIPVNVMIRPHAKSFHYSKEEIQTMKTDIKLAKQLGANGVVFGVLNEDNEICISSLESLLLECDGLDVTFHRAIDNMKDPVAGIKILSCYPQITNVLTSGGRSPIGKNINTLKEMIKEAKHINIMIGGGLNFNNTSTIIKETKAPFYHFGSTIRKDHSPDGPIETNKLIELVQLVNQTLKN